MSSSSSSRHRPASYTERQIADDNSNIKPRIPSIQQNSRRSDRDSPPPQSSKPSNVGMNHERAASSSQRTNRGVEERRRERVQGTTKETLTSTTRGPNLRHGPSVQLPQQPKPSEASRAHSGDPRPKPGKLEVSQLPWNPEVSLIPHTTALLASRVSIPPLASQAPQSLQPKPLQELSLEVQEAAILEDLLFDFMGYEGQYLRFSKKYNPLLEKDRLAGPIFKILPGLDPCLQDLTTAMLKMATYYGAIEEFIKVQSREEFGAVNHALCAAIRKLLHEYLVLIVQLEREFLTDVSFTLQVLHLFSLPTSHMMLQIYSLTHEILRKNSFLEEDENSDGDFDDIEVILENLLGGDLGPRNIPGKRICKGGSVLGLITKRLELMSGDPAAKSLLSSLLSDASRPYMTMLNEWLHYGSIKDAHGEFLVREQKSIRRERLHDDYTDEYWERRYTIRDYDIPPQLESAKDKVLLTGKYLNVIRECGGLDISTPVKEIPQSFDDNRFLDNINNAYAHANKSLLKLLLTTYALPARFQSLKHYFFLDQSDFFSYFLELGTSELRKPVDKVNTSKLQSLLDLVLHQAGSVTAQDPFRADVKVEMNQTSLMDSLTQVVNISGIEHREIFQKLASQPTKTDKSAVGFTSLQLDYSVPFPVSLVISRKTIWRYQALFRYLLSLRYLEQRLVSSWQTQNRAATWAHKSSTIELEMWKRRMFTLRARMLVFVQQLLYFCTSEVIEPNWQIFMEKVNAKEGSDSFSNPAVSTVDELMKHHVDFLDTCLKECMLTNSKLLKIHSKLMNTCTLFTTFTAWLSRELQNNDPELAGTERLANINSKQWARVQSDKPRHEDLSSSNSVGGTDARLEKMRDVIKKCEFNFGKNVQVLLDALNDYGATETNVLLGLYARLSVVNQGTEFDSLGTDEQDK